MLPYVGYNVRRRESDLSVQQKGGGRVTALRYVLLGAGIDRRE